jgi:hypothetical protein
MKPTYHFSPAAAMFEPKTGSTFLPGDWRSADLRFKNDGR